ncbi:transcriptional regulator [Longimycelium tulufanense]|uniref:Transcriptional regulator n=1 Tax=Longimycelium tulufanense TaxID=907463 RepID=A0A8J3CEL3_9PSEU|nr:helix-turn-helix transcriptional regulator [Longimycelium tulufanense]GGM67732.1 transcriptional regulator [Longimycelium tulufanense]
MSEAKIAAQIREARKARGWSMREAAAELVRRSGGKSADVESVVRAWRRWEKGTWPRSFYRAILAELLGLDMSLAGSQSGSYRDDVSPDRATCSNDGEQLGKVVDGEALTVPIFVGGRTVLVSVSRRDLLLRGGALAVLGVTSGLAHVPARAAGVDPAVVDRLIDLRSGLVDMDSLLGPGRLVTSVVEQIGTVESLLPVAPPDLRCQLFEVGALFAEFAGWLFDDAGQPAAGSMWSARAFEWAHAAQNPALISYILMRKAQQAVLTGDAAMAVGLASAAQQQRGPVPHRVVAIAAQQQAHGHALDHNEKAAVAAIDRAYSALGRATEPLDRFRLGSYCDVAYLHAQRGSCLLTLGQPRQAVAAFTDALGCWPSTYRRERGLHLARLSSALVAADEPAKAAAAARQALDVAAATGSVRTLAILHRVAADLPHTREPEVVAFRGDLSAIDQGAMT